MDICYLESISVDALINITEASHAIDEIYHEAVTDIELMYLDDMYMESGKSEGALQTIANSIKKMIKAIADSITKFFTGKARDSKEQKLREGLREHPELKNKKVEVPAHLLKDVNYEKYMAAIARGENPDTVLAALEKERNASQKKSGAGKAVAIGATATITLGALAAIYLNKDKIKHWNRVRTIGLEYTKQLEEAEGNMKRAKIDHKMEKKKKQYDMWAKRQARKEKEEEERHAEYDAERAQINKEYGAFKTILKKYHIDITATDSAIYSQCMKYFKPEEKIFEYDKKYAKDAAQNLADVVISLKRDKKTYEDDYEPGKQFSNDSLYRDEVLTDYERKTGRKIRHGLKKLNPLTKKQAGVDEALADINRARNKGPRKSKKKSN